VEWLSVAPVCAELQVGRPVVRAMIRDGELPAVRPTDRPGQPFRVERGALEAWVQG
jgi:excisionase family DNA binding protein